VARISVGIRLPHDLLEVDSGALRAFVAAVEQAGIDRVCVGDHILFRGGHGFDGMIGATAVAAVSNTLEVQTAVYLLPLRHPVAVARQIASLDPLAAGRFIFGVGIGGEHRAEMWACGIDPATRGRRMDESLSILRPLLLGEAVSVDGDFYRLANVQILPAPSSPVPIVIGGRSSVALRRVAQHGDGWLGLWVSPSRYADACAQIDDLAATAGRTVTQWRHGMHVWCGFGASPRAAREQLAHSMEHLYQLPFEAFERYCPYGSPAAIADALGPYVAAGCRTFNLIAGSGSEQEIIDGAREVRALLTAGVGDE
jgi:alkanesulfonate monooxygenase SsuD/methylene tetrahydromethanopterin reductase-like flavin-dependent oxidoreductase (luciferase family)